MTAMDDRVRKFLAALPPRADGGGRSADLRALAVPPGLRVAVAAPHPDDFDAVGVTFRLLHEAGAALSVAVLSGGASGVEDAFIAPPTRGAKAAAREAEQRESCRMFGLAPEALRFLRLDEDALGEPADTPSNERRLGGWLDEVAAQGVVLPHENDAKPGHRQAAAMVLRLAAARAGRLCVWMNHDPKTLAMRPDFHVPFGHVEAAWKAALLCCHASQHQRNLRTRGRGFDDRILDVNRAVARELGLAAEFAEAFEVRRFGPAAG